MRPLRPGQDIVLSSREGAVDCRVVAAAGRYVLLQPDHPGDVHLAISFSGKSSLTFLDGMVPVGWDGKVEAGSNPGELRFIVAESEHAADRRSNVRVPVMASIAATLQSGGALDGMILDVSAGGLRFRHAGRTQNGDILRVRCQLPGGPLIDADAVVRTAEQGVTSVEFQAMHAAQAQDVGLWTVNVLRQHVNHS